MGEYIPLEKLEVYILARGYSTLAWVIYEGFDWQPRKIIGDQMIRSVDSVGANVAEGYGRYHYLDKCKFYYNARGSLLESRHWFSVLFERTLIDEETFLQTKKLAEEIHVKVNALIQSQRANNNKQ
ncbi:MAG: four helix bundle protein [Candidatus Magasanikbacteria bacterium CG_4_9_14_0_2_um_filter_42_11]|uniref:Four helix bundle protein n=1 Tax=Candidatus Magasanikbacteria bacterium CG_4_9_14_0_2_um_filter_42_11 TaxID=1974643 RepID=A0A2M8FA45_9BACT|nr:MAG: four helix bundle protein [Candidatus Magasanikbacteria bacterium CG10_big_fil_rev_8_21_14_0_10_43_9]PIY92838.1 MAG: four helix bundle protein [Candidatus Magasanikbacteria bacterium CG_4_10_14_0_8_um_filter_42_12]PJC52539.1 MAG: four helix bundle protein [Candidatus Magasanikbacteria bacterium CG_4_9_14_0_2_um_filter_42_11]